MDSYFTRYYLIQSGGNSSIQNLYRSPDISQHGGGVGSFFRGLVRHASPLVSAGATTLKQQAVKTGKAILSEVGSKPIKTILKRQAKTAARKLTQKGINKLFRGLHNVVINNHSSRKRPNPFETKKSRSISKFKRRRYSKGRKAVKKSPS